MKIEQLGGGTGKLRYPAPHFIISFEFRHGPGVYSHMGSTSPHTGSPNHKCILPQGFSNDTDARGDSWCMCRNDLGVQGNSCFQEQPSVSGERKLTDKCSSWAIRRTRSLEGHAWVLVPSAVTSIIYFYIIFPSPIPPISHF